MNIHQQVSRAYWPRPELNESANREAGDAFVDGLTLAQIKEIYQTPYGPTFCFVRQRVTALLTTVLRVDEINDARSILEHQLDRFVSLVEKAQTQMEELVELRQ